EPPAHFVERLVVLTGAMPSMDPWELGIGVLTLAIIAWWSRRKWWLPPHLVGIAAGTAVAALLVAVSDGVDLATIGSRFGEIPREPPMPVLPWAFAGPDGQPLQLSWDLIRALIRPAFAIAMLGAIESLLCAVVADSMGGS